MTKIENFVLRGDGSGTLWLDQIVGSPVAATDNTPPHIEVELMEGGIKAQISDDMDAFFDTDYLAVYVDGAAVSYDMVDNVLTAPLDTRDGAAHRITVMAADSSGNMSRASLDVNMPETADMFCDMAGHWASSPVA